MICDRCGGEIKEDEEYGVALLSGFDWREHRKYFHKECMKHDRRREENKAN